MFRTFALLLLVPLLAACGGHDFWVDVDRSASEVRSELASLNPNALTASAGVRPVKTEWLSDGSVRYVLPKHQGKPGEVVIAIIEEGPNKTRLNVDVEVPFVTRESSTGTEFLDEDAMESALRKAMLAWARDFERRESTQSSMREVSEIVSVFAIGVQDFDKFEELASGAMYAAFENAMVEESWNETSEDWGGEESEGGWSASNEVADEYAYDDTEYDDGGWGDGG